MAAIGNEVRSHDGLLE